jgi:hypothetical protein
LPRKKKSKRRKKRSRYQLWYDDNSDELLAKRRKKYKRNKKYREAHVQRVRRNYWNNRPTTIAKSIRRKVKPSLFILVNDEEIPAYGIVDVAKLFGRTTRTIVGWIKTNVLPKPINHSTQRRSVRVYTEKEFALIRRHAPLLGHPKKSLRESVFARTLRRDMSYLRTGKLKIKLGE